MRINIEENGGKAFYIKIPNWIILNRLGIGFAAKSIVKSGKLGVTVVKGKDEIENKFVIRDKKELKLATKKMKRALRKSLGELRAFFKRHPDFVLVDVSGEDGEHVKIVF